MQNNLMASALYILLVEARMWARHKYSRRTAKVVRAMPTPHEGPFAAGMHRPQLCSPPLSFLNNLLQKLLDQV